MFPKPDCNPTYYSFPHAEQSSLPPFSLQKSPHRPSCANNYPKALQKIWRMSQSIPRIRQSLKTVSLGTRSEYHAPNWRHRRVQLQNRSIGQQQTENNKGNKSQKTLMIVMKQNGIMVENFDDGGGRMIDGGDQRLLWPSCVVVGK